MTTQTSQYKTVVKDIVIFATVLFTAFELLVSAGLINIQNSPYLPTNLQTQPQWWMNPVWWVLGLTLLVNFAGFVENVFITHEPYDIAKFGETFYKYLPLMVIISQFLPNSEASVLSLALDMMKRTFGNTTTTSTTTQQTAPKP